MDPSSGSGATDISKSELKNQELVVGARGFEPRASCAQGRRATRLRYAPTVKVSILTYFPDVSTAWCGSGCTLACAECAKVAGRAAEYESRCTSRVQQAAHAGKRA